MNRQTLKIIVTLLSMGIMGFLYTLYFRAPIVARTSEMVATIVSILLFMITFVVASKCCDKFVEKWEKILCSVESS